MTAAEHEKSVIIPEKPETQRHAMRHVPRGHYLADVIEVCALSMTDVRLKVLLRRGESLMTSASWKESEGESHGRFHHRRSGPIVVDEYHTGVYDGRDFHMEKNPKFRAYPVFVEGKRPNRSKHRVIIHVEWPEAPALP
jgi:hypothetical protein